MRIEITADDSITRQPRTYAEYRLFAALSEVVDTGVSRRRRWCCAAGSTGIVTASCAQCEWS
jgi:hypothetical protein